MNYFNYFLLTCMLFATSCSTIKNFRPTENDIPIIVNISKATRDVNTLPDSRDSIFISNMGDELLVVSIVYRFISIIVNNGSENTGVYAYPDGYKNTHIQKLHWGYNKVYIPKEIARSGGKMVYEAHGKRKAKWTAKIEPNNNIAM